MTMSPAEAAEWRDTQGGRHADTDAAFEAAMQLQRDVTYELRRLRARDTAQRMLRAERNGGPPPPALDLEEFLATPDPPACYRIDAVLPTGGRVVITAQYKAGKSTLVANLVRSLVDGHPFLGRYDVTPPDGRVVLVDNELDERTLRRWLRDQRIEQSSRVAVIPLRGRVTTFDLLDDDTRARWAKQLRSLGAAVLVVDCLRPLLDALGLDESRDAGRFLVALDALMVDAGVGELLLAHHMGHNGERSRGDSRILDWPDATWRLVREVGEDGQAEPDARRYFSAYGRDVDQPEGLLAYDPASRRLTLAGGSRRDTAAEGAMPALLEYLEANPGATKKAIEAALTARHSRRSVRDAVCRAVEKGLVDIARGPNRSDLHLLTEQTAVAS